MRSLETLTGEAWGDDGAAWLGWVRHRDPETLFENQLTYHWLPYQKPLGLLDNLQFWKGDQTVHPRLPKATDGMDAPHSSPPPHDS